ncbi:hypothetical protein MC7420_1396 [Coleofasciculus chthonoplastes PCC 7420]|uniref:Uncharacterized protein n=1 Tax=Coleofasciculus chthonoplastes PCC 7420 TaxID=118168 RepID=B4VR68_9CYAN|nr:hypothetical protein MC7420_1396 [Coleofasciculus chthonoplastes PCC 7420]
MKRPGIILTLLGNTRKFNLYCDPEFNSNPRGRTIHINL